MRQFNPDHLLVIKESYQQQIYRYPNWPTICNFYQKEIAKLNKLLECWSKRSFVTKT